MVYRDPKYGLPAAEDTDVAKTWPTLSRELVDDLAALFTMADTWTPFTPTLTGFTASAVDARYLRRGGVCTVNAKFTVAAVTGTAGFSAPVTPTADAPGVGYAYDVGSVRYPLTLYIAAATPTIYMYMHKTDAANATLAGFTASTPFAWAPGDLIVASATFQVAPTP